MSKIIRLINRVRTLFLETFYWDYIINKRYNRRGQCNRCGKCCKKCPYLKLDNGKFKCIVYNSHICHHDAFPRDKFDIWSRGIKECGFYWKNEKNK